MELIEVYCVLPRLFFDLLHTDIHTSAPLVVLPSGYLTNETYKAAKEVEPIKLESTDSNFRQHMAKIFFAFGLVAMITGWAMVQYAFG